MGSLDGRVFIVTGAGRGIRREHARLCAAEGAQVVVNDLGTAMDGSGRDVAPAEQVAKQIHAMGGDALATHVSMFARSLGQPSVSYGGPPKAGAVLERSGLA